MSRNSLLLICLLALALVFNISGFSFKHQKRSSLHSPIHPSGSELSQYVAPERDPEYRNVIKPSLLQPSANPGSGETKLNAAIQLPVPKDGDVVSNSAIYSIKLHNILINNLCLY